MERDEATAARPYRAKYDGVSLEFRTATERDRADRLVERRELLSRARLGAPLSTQLLSPTTHDTLARGRADHFGTINSTDNH